MLILCFPVGIRTSFSSLIVVNKNLEAYRNIDVVERSAEVAEINRNSFSVFSISDLLTGWLK
jgi:hypothetical protein